MGPGGGLLPAGLRRELLTLFAVGVDATPDDARFDHLALQLFAYQWESNPVYHNYCLRRGADPTTVRRWTDVPAVPTAAFKAVPLVCGPADHVDRVFRTSGTTLGQERRGEHLVPDLSLYDAALVATFRGFVLADGARLPLLSLVPPASELPDSSLAYMVSQLQERCGAAGSRSFASTRSGIDAEGLGRALLEAAETHRAVALLGTSLAFLDWLETGAGRELRLRLPPGSRIMDTGGYKGKRRRVGEEALRTLYRERLGVPPELCINEYGMTELLSQYYDTVLRDRLRGLDTRGPRRKAGPPWLHSLIVDPRTLEPVAPGEVGILRHLDLANAGSVLAVQTEDLARQEDGGFVLLGRVPDAPPRGCSIAMDILLQAAPATPP
jgi:hypothetical protein